MERKTEKEIEHSLRIPKRHALRYYLKKVCELYGEPSPDYIEEQLKANEDDLDKAIESFKGVIDGQKVQRHAVGQRTGLSGSERASGEEESD